MRKKNKKGFTLLEVVIALAVVSLICALVLPLTNSAMNSFNAAQSMRDTASTTGKRMSTIKYKDSGKSEEKMYVTIKYNNSLGITTESQLLFSKTEASNAKYDIKITYYDLEQKNVKGTASS